LLPDAKAERIAGWVADFCHGEAFGSYPGELAMRAEALLGAWLTAACDRGGVGPEDLELDDLRAALLDRITRLDLPADAHMAVPGLCRDFLSDLEQAGRLADGRSMGQFVLAADPAYQRAVRGEVEQLRRPGTKLGRNDPCPCGSGKKYKRCCLRR
jgi:hypothetical protein